MPERARRRPARRRPVLIPVVLILLGIAVLLYPVVGTYVGNVRRAQGADTYIAAVASVPPTTTDAQLAAARAYNAALPATSLQDPWVSGDTASPAQAEYQRQLSVTDAMARLRIPRIAVDLPVYHGTTEASLDRGVGHFFGSSLPVGGPGTHAVLAAHSGMESGTLFDRLPELGLGDTFYIDVLGQTLTYRVDRIDVVLPDDLSQLGRDRDGDTVTLVTCVPRTINTHRLLVRGTRIPTPPNGIAVAHSWTAAVAGADWSVQPWMLPRVIAAGVAALLIVALLVNAARRPRERRPQARATAQESR